MTHADAHACVHCGTLVSERAAVWRNEQPFCCSGCATVAEIIADGGWDSFYDKRDGFSPRPEDLAVSAFDSDVFQQMHVITLDDGRRQAELQVQGVRCAACTWLVERAVGDLDGVEDCHVSYATNRATITWDPDRTRLSNIAGRIGEVGYKPLATDQKVQHDHDLLARLGVAGFVAMNVMLMSASVYIGWFEGMEAKYHRLFQWASLALVTPAVLYSAQPFFERAWQGLRHRVLQMDLPIAIAVTLMYGHGIVATLTGHDGYLDSLSMLIALLLAGRVVEESGRSRAEAASAAVLAEAPRTARRVVGDRIEEVAADVLRVGDRVAVGVGESVPVDGRIVHGDARVDLALITGESEPRAVRLGDDLPAGAGIVDGAIELEATAVGDGTLLAEMARLVQKARSERAPRQQLADRIAPWFTGATLTAAAVTLVGWSAFAGIGVALPITVAVLVVACPCALALATPAAFSVGLGAAARRGAFVRDGATLDRIADVDLVVIDKTGTLTEGRPRVIEASDEVLRLATGLERASNHPVARAILDEAARRRIPIAAGESVREQVGRGIEGIVDGRHLALRAAGDETVGLFEGDELIGEIRLRDRLRADSVAALRTLGVPFHMLTGDTDARARRIAEDAGGIPVTAGVTPDEKAAFVRARRAEGHVVLFAGDGLNDAPALAEADVGIAMGSGSTAAVMGADGVIVTEALQPLAEAMRAARETRRALARNTRFSVAYNVLAVIAAVSGVVNPLVAAILMPISSFTVVAGAVAIERRMSNGHRDGSAAPVDRHGGRVRVALRPSRA